MRQEAMLQYTAQYGRLGLSVSVGGPVVSYSTKGEGTRMVIASVVMV